MFIMAPTLPFIVPSKLPMICKPLDYTPDVLGGFLLNDKRYTEPLFIEKPVYGISSVVNVEDNSIYQTINNISKTPFKINQMLLDYITSNIGSHLLLDPTKEHENQKIGKKIFLPSISYNLACWEFFFIYQYHCLHLFHLAFYG